MRDSRRQRRLLIRLPSCASKMIPAGKAAKGKREELAKGKGTGFTQQTLVIQQSSLFVSPPKQSTEQRQERREREREAGGQRGGVVEAYSLCSSDEETGGSSQQKAPVVPEGGKAPAAVPESGKARAAAHKVDSPVSRSTRRCADMRTKMCRHVCCADMHLKMDACGPMISEPMQELVVGPGPPVKKKRLQQPPAILPDQLLQELKNFRHAKRRRVYTEDAKTMALQVLDACKGVVVSCVNALHLHAQYEFGDVNRKNIMDWRQRRREGKLLVQKRGPRVDAAFELEVLSRLIFVSLNSNAKGVSSFALDADVIFSYKQVADIATQLQMRDEWKTSPIYTLKFSPTWVHNFLERASMSRRKVTVVDKVRPSQEEIRVHMKEEVQDEIVRLKVSTRRIANGDETGVNWGIMPAYVYLPKGIARGCVPVSDEKGRFTAMLWANGAGEMGPMFIIIKCSSAANDLSTTRVINTLHKLEGFREEDGYDFFYWELEWTEVNDDTGEVRVSRVSQLYFRKISPFFCQKVLLQCLILRRRARSYLPMPRLERLCWNVHVGRSHSRSVASRRPHRVPPRRGRVPRHGHGGRQLLGSFYWHCQGLFQEAPPHHSPHTPQREHHGLASSYGPCGEWAS